MSTEKQITFIYKGAAAFKPMAYTGAAAFNPNGDNKENQFVVPVMELKPGVDLKMLCLHPDALEPNRYDVVCFVVLDGNRALFL